MTKEKDPKDSTKAKAFALWMQAANPMITLIKTLDITKLMKAEQIGTCPGIAW